ncbi:hypothetical protein [Massilia sp. PWRC2]|uniref:hypothetical protein n=1 Tax=Massilia sp. PWRC2 TaxID=2804626 RepID=UPI003CF59746
MPICSLLLKALPALLVLTTQLPALAQTAPPPSWGPTLAPATPLAPQPERVPAVPANVAAARTAPAAGARAPARRAVTQQLTPTPRILGSSATPAIASPGRPAVPAPVRQQGSVPATCNGAGCVDASGQRLGTGVGNAAVTPQGQLCTRGLVGVQCF